MVGAQLAALRKAAGHTQRSLAERVVVDEETIASIEQGRRPLKEDLAQLLDELLEAKGVLSVAVNNLPELDLFPRWAEEYIDLEREAIASPGTRTKCCQVCCRPKPTQGRSCATTYRLSPERRSNCVWPPASLARKSSIGRTLRRSASSSPR
jgi:transcriptional regulator with XRE-family HTH domain